jgi:hypothetical protein
MLEVRVSRANPDEKTIPNQQVAESRGLRLG